MIESIERAGRIMYWFLFSDEQDIASMVCGFYDADLAIGRIGFLALEMKDKCHRPGDLRLPTRVVKWVWRVGSLHCWGALFVDAIRPYLAKRYSATTDKFGVMLMAAR